MSHQFDTAALRPQRTRIQQGAVTTLAGLKKSNGGYLVEVMPFPITLHRDSHPEEVAQFVLALSRAPSIAVALGDRDSQVRSIGGYSEWGDISVHVYFSSTNARNPQVGRQETDTAGLANDQADPGLHVILDHAKELLIGQRFAAGTDIKQCRPHMERQLISEQQITIWEQIYKVAVMVQISEFRTVSQLLTSLRFRTAIEPTEVPLPATKIDHATVDINVDLT
jgi:hypothetical protein